MSPHGYIFQSAENNLFVRRLRDFFPQKNRNTCAVRFCSEVDIPKKTGIQQKIPYLPTGALAFTRSFVPNFGILDSEWRLGMALRVSRDGHVVTYFSTDLLASSIHGTR